MNLKYFLFTFFIAINSSLLSQTDSTFKKRFNQRHLLIEEGAMVAGQQQGEWKFYDDSLGYLYRIEHYKNGFPDGEFKEFNPNGVIVLKGTYSLKSTKRYKEKTKAPQGIASYYEPRPVGELLYYNDQGVLIKREFYNSKGKLKKTEVIK